MPTASSPNQTDFDLPISLSQGQATLRMPFPMTSADFEKIKTVLTQTLEPLKGALVRDDPPEADHVGFVCTSETSTKEAIARFEQGIVQCKRLPFQSTHSPSH